MEGLGDPRAAHFIIFANTLYRWRWMQCREKVTLAACTRTCTRLLPSVVCVGCRTFEGLKGNFSKAISGVLVSEWVGVDSFGRGVENGGLHPFPAGW